MPLADDVDDLLVALRRSERELDLAIDDQVEAGRYVAFVEQDVTAQRVDFARAARDARDLVLLETAEQRHVREQRLDVDSLV